MHRAPGFKKMHSLTLSPQSTANLGRRYAVGEHLMYEEGFFERVRRIAFTSLILATFAALAPCSVRAASSVTLAWDPSPSGGVAGYNVYYGPASGTYTNMVTAGNATNATVSGL